MPNLPAAFPTPPLPSGGWMVIDESPNHTESLWVPAYDPYIYGATVTGTFVSNAIPLPPVEEHVFEDTEEMYEEGPVPEQMFFLGDRVHISSECLEDNGLDPSVTGNVYGTVTNVEEEGSWNGDIRYYYDVRLDFPEYSSEIEETVEYVAGWEWQFEASPFPKIEKKGKKRAGGFASFMKKIEGKEEASV